MYRFIIVALLLAAPAYSADPAPPPPWIVPPVPTVPVPPQPTPPAPDAVVLLPADVLYVLDVKEPCFYTVSPAGFLAVTQNAGPTTVYAKQYGGTGGIELKTYAGPAAVLMVRAIGAGRATLTVTRVGAKTQSDVFTQVIDALNGPLPPPKPPDPIPPKPPDPAPGPSLNPFGKDTVGMHVLIVEESADRSKIPPGQIDVMFGKSVRDYLNAHCPMDPDLKRPAWNIWDKDVPLDNVSDVWRKALARDRKSLPWLLVGNGPAGYEGPLPADPASMLALLQKFEVVK